VAFYEDPENNPLTTPSGKIEFYSQRLADNFPNDRERGPVPQYIAEGVTHQESLSCERAKRYSLLFVSNHPRWRVHAEHDDISWLREIETCKVKGPEGYLYEPVWLHPSDAEARGIEHGDVVNVYNERGIVLGGAYVTERISPGVVYQDHGSRVDPIVPGEIDRGGSNNLIAPTGITSKNCAGMATSGFLVEVEKTNLADLRAKYPEAFTREYDSATGPLLFSWVTGGK
ncbi:molybdopterin dinucleotide binding domain-containing protein, partial [Chloroflexota bacterium]